MLMPRNPEKQDGRVGEVCVQLLSQVHVRTLSVRWQGAIVHHRLVIEGEGVSWTGISNNHDRPLQLCSI